MQLSCTRVLVLPAFVRRAKVRDVTHEGQFHNPASETTLSYYNYTDSNVYILHRNGLCTVMPPLLSRKHPLQSELIIRSQVSNDRLTWVMMDNQVIREGKHPSAEAETIRHAAAHAYHIKEGKFAHRKFNVEYLFTQGEIAKYENGLYCPELDIVITTDETKSRKMLHPFSELAIDMKAAMEYGTEANIAPFIFFMNDHGHNYSPRWLRFGREVFKVPLMHDLEREQGFHITTPTPVSFQDQSLKIRTQVLTMDEADKALPLFKTLEDAEAGDQLELDKLDRIHRNQINDLKLKELKIRENDLKMKEEELGFRKDDLGYRNSELNFRKYSLEETSKMEKDKRVDEREKRLVDDEIRRKAMRSNDRKALRGDMLECAKTVLGLATTIMAAYKLFSSSK